MILDRRVFAALAIACAIQLTSISPAVADGLNTTGIDTALGRAGQTLPGDVYKVGFPRTDLHVVVDGVELKPGLALGSYAVFKQYGKSTLMMGDLVLLASEVEPVMQSLLESGLQITALHNHLLGAAPMVFYMHYMGAGDAPALAASLRRALAASATPLNPPGPPAAPQPVWFQASVEQALGHEGKVSGGVLSVSVPRAIDESMDGMTLPPAMGTAEVMNFQDAGGQKIATTGDFSLTADEVTPVLRALRNHGIEVGALHMHMLDDSPRLFYVHWWAVGEPGTVASGLKSALDRIHTR